MDSLWDIIIVGSGAAGGRIAAEASKTGARCLLLEAGKHFTRKTFPPNEMDYSTQLFWGGGIEINQMGTLAFLRARCVGGTTVVNQALLDRFTPKVWQDWKERTGISYFSEREMETHYRNVESTLSIETIEPAAWNRNAKIFVDALESSGYQWSPLRRAQKNCRYLEGSDCILCLGGCKRDSKQSTLVTSIPEALNNGLKLLPEFQVDQVIPYSDRVEVSGQQKGKPVLLKTRQLVLSAGSFGSTRILLNSGFGKKMPSLGKNFSCHPQYMTFARFNEPVDAFKGAFQAVKSGDTKIHSAGFKFENVFAPPIGTAMLIPGWGKKHMMKMENYKNYASMEICIKDDATGSLITDKNGNLKISKNLTQADLKKKKDGLTLVREIFCQAGAEEVISCEQGFGLHLMGGCSIGQDPGTSVVDPEFHLHGQKNISVVDSSLFPSSPGINPSLSIMALADRAKSHILGAIK